MNHSIARFLFALILCVQIVTITQAQNWPSFTRSANAQNLTPHAENLRNPWTGNLPVTNFH